MSSAAVDSIIINLACDMFEETSDPSDDGEIDKEGNAFFNNYPALLKAKEQFSNSGILSVASRV